MATIVPGYLPAVMCRRHRFCMTDVISCRPACGRSDTGPAAGLGGPGQRLAEQPTVVLCDAHRVGVGARTRLAHRGGEVVAYRAFAKAGRASYVGHGAPARCHT